jgi:hypothetical protein
VPFTGPYQIDPGFQNWDFERRQAWTVYEYGGSLFAVLSTGSGQSHIFKSTDGLVGAAWQNLGVNIARATCTVVRKGDILYFLYHQATGGGGAGEINLTSFNLVTETAGAIVAGGPAANGTNNFTVYGHLRTDGDIDFCFRDATLVAPTLWAATYSFTTSWSVAIQVDVAVAGTDPQILTSIESGNNRLHIFWYAVTGGDPAVYHRSYLNGVLGANSTFLATTGVALPFCNVGVGAWNPNTTLLLLPVVIGAAGAGVLYVYRAGDAATPAWAQGAALSSTYTPGSCLFTHYFVVIRGTNEEVWWLTYQALSPLGTNLLIRQVNTGAGYGAEQVIYNTSAWTQESSWHNIFAIPLSDGTLGITGSLESDVFCTAVFARWADPVGAQVAREVTGTRRMVVLVPNYWDHCLWKDPPVHRKIPPLSACCGVTARSDYFKYVEMPEGAIPFYRTAGIPTPLAAAGDVLIFAYEVPVGYDGIIRGLFHHYTGPGFLEGNGDLEWRLKVNRVYAQYLGDVLVSLGSVGEPMPLEDGIPITSRQRVEYIVSAPTLSGGILPVDSRIVAGIAGWLVVRR